MTNGPDPGEAGVGQTQAPPLGIGWKAVLGAGAVGVGLTIAQLAVLHGTWTSCEAGGPLDDDFPAGAAYTWFVADSVRWAVYAVAFLAGVVVGRRRIAPRGRGGRAGTWLRVLIVVVLCAAPFFVDFAWGVRMDPGTYDPARCPGGVPRWWPF